MTIRYVADHAWDCMQPGLWTARGLLNVFVSRTQMGWTTQRTELVFERMVDAMESAIKGSDSPQEESEPEPVEATPEGARRPDEPTPTTLSEGTPNDHEDEDEEPHAAAQYAFFGREMGGDQRGERPVLEAVEPEGGAEAERRPLPRTPARSGDEATGQSISLDVGGGRVTIFHERWQDTLAREGFREAGFDHVITDPPFSERVHTKQAHGRNDGSEGGLHDVGFGYDSMTELEAHFFVQEIDAVVRGWFCVITSHDMIPVFEEAFRLLTKRYVFAPVPCIQRGSSVRLQGDGPSSLTAYLIATRPKTRLAMAWRTLPGFYNARRAERHGVQGAKSVELMSAIVRDYSDPGDVIFDPFMGGGSTLVAARELGRRALGSEPRLLPFNVAEHRLSKPYQAVML